MTTYTYNVPSQLHAGHDAAGEGTQTRTFQWTGSDMVERHQPGKRDGDVYIRRRAPGDAADRCQGAEDAIHLRRLRAADAEAVFRVGEPSLTEQPAQEVDYYYDTNPLNGSYSAQAWGRLAAVTFAAGYSYQFSYNQAGQGDQAEAADAGPAEPAAGGVRGAIRVGQ